MTKQEAERPRRTLPEVLTDIVQQQAPTDCNYTIVILCGAILIADNRDRKRSRCVFLSFPHSSPGSAPNKANSDLLSGFLLYQNACASTSRITFPSNNRSLCSNSKLYNSIIKVSEWRARATLMIDVIGETRLDENVAREVLS